MRTADRRSDGDGRQRAPDRPLTPKELRRLIERDAELDKKFAQAPATLDAARARVRMLANQQEALSRSIEDFRARLVGARATLAEQDRPLFRRRHRVELDAARADLAALPRSIEEVWTNLAEERQAPRSGRRLGDAAAAVTDLRELRVERALISHALEQDARLRGWDPQTALPAVVMDRLGTPPTCGPERDLWIDAAGRLAQHHAAFELHGSTLAGPAPRPFGRDDAYAASHWAAVQAVKRLDRALGRELEIEPLHRSLGKSL